MSRRDERTPEQKLEDSHLYGLCQTCGAPRSSRVVRVRNGVATVRMFCPACAADENGQGDSPASVRDWRDLRREIVALISAGMDANSRGERRYIKASDLLAEYVTALDIAKGDVSHG